MSYTGRASLPAESAFKVCPVGEDRRLYGRMDASIYSKRDRFPERHRAWSMSDPMEGFDGLEGG